MDIEKLTHQTHRISVIIAIVLSAMVVTLAALIGRGTLNLKSALLASEPTDVTVIAAVEPRLGTGTTITNIVFLRKRTASGAERVKPTYDYLVRTSDGDSSLVQLAWGSGKGVWMLRTFERLHGETSETMTND